MFILDGIQSYVGVLATFVVLCLFSVRSRNERDENQSDDQSVNSEKGDSNFIYALIRQFGADSLSMIIKDIEKLKGKYGDCYDKKDLDGKTRMQRSIERARNEHQGEKYEQLLLKSQARYKSSISEFSNKAYERIKEFKKTQRMGLNDELTYVALMTLIFIVIVMMIDTLMFIPVTWRALWMNILVACSSPFLFYLYVRFCHKPTPTYIMIFKKQKKWGGIKILLLASSPFLLWLFIASFINVPFFSLALLIPIMGIFYVVADKLVCQMGGNTDFSRSFILRLSVYFLFMSAFISLLFILSQKWSFCYEWGISRGLSLFMDNINNAVQLLFSKDIAKYSVVFYFSLNVFILPLMLGYWYIHRMTKDLSDEIHEMFVLSEETIEEAISSFKQIVLDMDSKPDNTSHN